MKTVLTVLFRSVVFKVYSVSGIKDTEQKGSGTDPPRDASGSSSGGLWAGRRVHASCEARTAADPRPPQQKRAFWCDESMLLLGSAFLPRSCSNADQTCSSFTYLQFYIICRVCRHCSELHVQRHLKTCNHLLCSEQIQTNSEKTWMLWKCEKITECKNLPNSDLLFVY